MEIRTAMAPEDVEGAVALDEAVLGSNERAAYIREVARAGGLAVAVRQGRVAAFTCLDHRYFFGRPFVSLLIVAPEARRLGLGSALLSGAASRNERSGPPPIAPTRPCASCSTRRGGCIAER